MTAVEIIALIFVALSVVKFIVLFTKPAAWYGSPNPLIKLVQNQVSAIIFSLVLGGVILYYLLLEISIVQVFAAMAFSFILLIFTMAPDVRKIFDPLVRHLEGQKLFARYWFPLLVWLALMAWVVWEIFA